MIIVAGGDSFVYGAELKDCDDKINKHSVSTFPALLADSVHTEYVCTAENGNANNAIARQVMSACESYKNQNVFAIVMWTFTHRYEFRFNYHTYRRSSPWYSLNLWDIADDPSSIKKEFVTSNEAIFETHVNNKLILDNIGLTDFAKIYYKHIGNNEYYETYTSLKEILFLQQYLEINQIPYLFVSADVYLQNHESYLRHQTDPSISAIYNQINWANWYTFPAGTGPDQTEHPRGFYQWAVENKYSVGTTHPLEQAHQAAANLIQEKFNELVKKSI
jgi:hypothetical protein